MQGQLKFAQGAHGNRPRPVRGEAIWRRESLALDDGAHMLHFDILAQRQFCQYAGQSWKPYEEGLGLALPVAVEGAVKKIEGMLAVATTQACVSGDKLPCFAHEGDIVAVGVFYSPSIPIVGCFEVIDICMAVGEKAFETCTLRRTNS